MIIMFTELGTAYKNDIFRLEVPVYLKIILKYFNSLDEVLQSQTDFGYIIPKLIVARCTY